MQDRLLTIFADENSLGTSNKILFVLTPDASYSILLIILKSNNTKHNTGTSQTVPLVNLYLSF